VDARSRYDEIADDLAAQNADVELGLFDPSGGKRAPMKEWVVVPTAHTGNWREFADQALR
jgi:hypothetical protein